MTRALHPPMILVSVVVAVTACTGPTPSMGTLDPIEDSVSYRPAVAAAAPAPDCVAKNIYTALTGLWSGATELSVDAPDPGYPPADFVPVAVVRCERGRDETGALTVDSVRLGGDIDAVHAAFSAESERFPDGVMASCVYSMDPPAGLWLVDAAGRAFRPAWPAEPCGLQDEPVATLAALTEVSRSSRPTGYNDRHSTVCEASPNNAVFDTTAPADVTAAEERERSHTAPVAPSLVMPINDVDALQFCTYQASAGQPSPLDGIGATGTRTVVDRPDSAAIVRAITNAPIAPPCSQSATRIASTHLTRPDGSGSSPLSFELDGCTRASGIGYYRTIPPHILAHFATGA